MSSFSSLPADLLDRISTKLRSFSDYLRYRAVCTRFLYSSCPPPQLPWLLQYRDPSTADNSTVLRFYSLYSDTVHTVSCFKADGKWLKGPSNGYFLATDCVTDEMSLLNPVSGKEISLPFLDVAAAWPDWIGMDIVVVSGDSLVISGDSFYTDTDKRIIAFCRPGDKKWSTLEEDSYQSGGHLYFNGTYFIVDRTTGITKIIDLASKTVKHLIPPAETETSSYNYIHSAKLAYLVESAGKILRVVQYLPWDLSTRENEIRSFDIYQLDFGEGSVEPYWVKINGIGDQILFLDLFHGFKGLSFRASDFDGFSGNCIYFLKDTFQGCILCKYEIENDTIEVLPCPFELGGTWIVPSLC